MTLTREQRKTEQGKLQRAWEGKTMSQDKATRCTECNVTNRDNHGHPRCAECAAWWDKNVIEHPNGDLTIKVAPYCRVVAYRTLRPCADAQHTPIELRKVAWSCFVEDRKYNHGPYGLYDTRADAVAAAMATWDRVK